MTARRPVFQRDGLFFGELENPSPQHTLRRDTTYADYRAPKGPYGIPDRQPRSNEDRFSHEIGVRLATGRVVADQWRLLR